MVRKFDPSESDYVQHFIKYLFRPSDGKGLTSEAIKRETERLASGDSELIETLRQDFPTTYHLPPIHTLSNCGKRGLWGSDNRHFPAFYDRHQNTLKLCTNFIGSMVELKENLLREASFANSLRKLGDRPPALSDLAGGYLHGCHRSLELYLADPRSARLSSEVCAEYILKYRDFNSDDLPIDAWSRLVKKVVRETSDSVLSK
jgi:hypothetical protein